MATPPLSLSPHFALILPLSEYSHFHACPTSTSPSLFSFVRVNNIFVPVDSSSRIQHLHLSICSKCRKKPLSLLLPRLVPHSLAFSAFLRKSRLHVFGARYSYKQLNSQMNPPTSGWDGIGVDLCEISRVAWQAWLADPFGHEK